MEEVILSDDVIEQIKDFDCHYWNLTKEQRLLIDKLILNEELKKCYQWYDLCKECKQPNTNSNWCQSCNAKRFQQNFKNWTSGNHDIDKFIQETQLKAKNSKQVIEWIKCDKFENIEYLAKGGFGTAYKATWKDRYIIDSWDSENDQWKKYHCSEIAVVLKCLHDSQDITVEFLRETESHIEVNNLEGVVKFYGITKNLETNGFMMVMERAEYGNLRKYLDERFNSLDWKKKLFNLYYITKGLHSIHDKNLIHHDFHCGNILNHLHNEVMITDLGLCRPANVKSDDKNIYGVLPYVAPEVLRGKEYTLASDVYGFGIIAYEICTGLPPYHDIAHDEFLAIRICQGLRPKSNYKVPQLILDIIEQCWDADSLKRPKANELENLFKKLLDDCINKNLEQFKEADEINKKSLSSTAPSTDILSYSTHPQAIYTSSLLNFKNLPEPKNAADGDDNSESVKMDFTKPNVGSKDETN